MPRRFPLLAFLLLAPVAQAQFLKPADNLIVENIPPIPSAIAAKANRYGSFRAAAIADWHPAKREMLVFTRFADTTQIHAVAAPGAARRQLTFFPENIAWASYEPTAGKYIVFTSSKGGNERYQLYRFDPATGDITLLTDGKARNSGFHWSRKGDKVAYGSTRRNGADVDLYLMDPADPKSDRLLIELKGGGWSVLDWSPDDGRLLVAEYVSINDARLHVVDVETGAMKRITPPPRTTPDGKVAEMVAYIGGKFSKDGKHIYTTSDAGSEFRQLVSLEIAAGGKIKRLLPEQPWDVQSFALSGDGAQLAYIANEDGVGALYLLDLETSRVSQPKLPSGSVADLDWHRRDNVLGFVLTSAHAPADVFSLDAEKGVQRWTTSETAIPTAAFREPRPISWKGGDGLALTGLAYFPPKKFKDKLPVVINIHGGPESQARPGFLGRLNYLVQEMGVVLIYPNVRGSAGYGKKFLQLDNGFLREGAYQDIGALLDWIATQPDLDAERVMVMGGSYGGHMTLAVAYLYADKIRCAVDIVGISNLRTFLENTESYRRDLRRVEYGDERDPKMRAFLDRIAPMNHLDKITKPLFIIHGANDPRVPLSEAEQILKALKKQGTPVWYLVAKDEGHGFAKKSNADFQFYATVRFMEEHLLGKK